MNIKTILFISGLALIFAIFPLPYFYYQLLRIFIFFSAGYVAFKFYAQEMIPWTLIFSAVALLFNPLFPIFLDKGSWVVIDFISAILFFTATHSARRKN
jgi:uncharacterized membrane protein SirB2